MNPYKSYMMGAKRVRAALTKPNENTLTMMPVRSLVYLPVGYKKLLTRTLSSMAGKPLLLLADHHPSHEHEVYLGLHINAKIELTEKFTGVHPVTNLATQEFNSGTRFVDGVFELGRSKDELSLIVEKSVYYLAEPVSQNDKLDGRTIKKVRKLSGLYRVEVD